jgi:glycosyl transferase family 1
MNEGGGGKMMQMRQPWQTALRLNKLRLREKLEFDIPLFKKVTGYGGLFLGLLCYAGKQTRTAFRLFSGVHAAACSPRVSRFVERIIRSAVQSKTQQKNSSALVKVFQEHIEDLTPAVRTKKFFENPQKMFGSMAIVLKSPSSGERGVISILYSYALPLFAKLFDVERIAQRYFLVLEPSWSGYCNLDVLSYTQFNFPIFVQAYEPRDSEFITSIHSNLIPVPLSNNWWVDHRVFKPLPDVRQKDIDVIMVAGWADFKRHYRFFQTLQKLLQQGIALKVVLVGYPMEKTKKDVYDEASCYGVADHLEIYESITQEEVNSLLNRAKVNVIWSRKEGVNRAVIEGLFAGVPFLLREGFNYGYHYPYVNNSTGCFVSERELSEKLLWFRENYQTFSPRAWVLEHMSCQKATLILAEAIGKVALSRGESWTGNLSVKVNGLHGMQYWDSEDHKRFSTDYDFLTTCIRPSGGLPDNTTALI